MASIESVAERIAAVAWRCATPGDPLAFENESALREWVEDVLHDSGCEVAPLQGDLDPSGRAGRGGE